MEIIQSYWSCSKDDLLADQAGWLAPEFNLMSWTLSCLQLKKHYDQVTLYCDRKSKKLLIDELALPYTDVRCELDVLNSYQKGLWAIPKIYAYSKQEKPFLHVDGDVFIWEKFPPELLNKALIAQNMEYATDYYERIMQELEGNLRFFPESIRQERENGNPILAYNAGILGGSDIAFFKTYTKSAFEFITKNLDKLDSIQVSNFNIFFEQYLFYCLAKKHDKKVDVLIDRILGDNQYKGFGDFIEVPYNKTYLHLLGNYKKNESVCLQLANRLRKDFPTYYYKIIDLYRTNGRPLHYDFYSFTINRYASELLPRYQQLKDDFTNELIPKRSEKIDHVPLEKIVPDGLNVKQISDLGDFYRKLEKIRRNKFSRISKHFLYGRDINHTQYFEHLFTDLKDIYSKIIVADGEYSIIESEYDWSGIMDTVFRMNLKGNGEKAKALVVPECHAIGCSLSDVDLLDLEILHILITKKTVGRLINECKKMFPREELKESRLEFEKLIIGRIKKGIHSKVIRAIMT